MKAIIADQNIEDSFFDPHEELQEDCPLYGLRVEKKQDLYKKVYAPEEKDKIVISVLDTGIGIKEQDQDNLFKMFGCLKSTKQMNT